MKIQQTTTTNEPTTEEDKRLHLQLIQDTITRMAGNLFYLRGWSITLAAGLLALLSQKKEDGVILFPLIILGLVTIIFWIYDGYFLAQERRYRKLFDKVRKTSKDKIDFSMDASEFSGDKKCTVPYCMISKTLWPFYVFLLVATLYLIYTASR